MNDSLVFVLQATPDRERHEAMLQHVGLKLAFEAFGDRAYEADGRLRPRSLKGALLTRPAHVAAHVSNLAQGTVDTPAGRLELEADTLCIHGDNPAAPEALRLVRELIPRAP